MVLYTLFSEKQRTITIIALVMLGVGLIGQFVTSLIWWQRIHPWFSYGRGIYRIVYNNVASCWVLSLIAIAVLAVYVALDLFAKKVFNTLTGSLSGTLTCISLVGIFSAAGIITGAYAASFALDRYNFKDDGSLVFAQFQHLCNGYYDSTAMTLPSALKNTEERAKYNVWKEKLDKKAKSSRGLNNSYLCETVGAPTLVFSMISALSIVIFFYLLAISAFNSNNSDKSEDEA